MTFMASTMHKTVSGVTSSLGNGAYTVGQAVPVQVPAGASVHLPEVILVQYQPAGPAPLHMAWVVMHASPAQVPPLAVQTSWGMAVQ